MSGEIGILNVGAGDTKLVFDPKKPEEVKRASATLKDMIRRGFAILIEIGHDDKGPIYRRAHDFDADTAEYIIAGLPGELESNDDEKPTAPPRRRKERAGKGRRFPAAAARGIAVAPTAGG